jgi:squalene-hopene/tetraprenyl-beta-curcumene cyclase
MKRVFAAAAAIALAGLCHLAPPRPALAQEKPAAPPASDLRARVDKAMEKGAGWLVAHQNANGSFGKIPNAAEPGEAGMTGLALRALAKAPPEVRKPNEAAIAKAAAYLQSLQRADGAVTNPGTGLTTYRTAIAITAWLAADPAKYADNVHRARAYLEASQFSEEHGLEGGDPKKSPFYGGWGYDKTETQPSADMSNVQFSLEALREAGVAPDSPVFKRAAVFLSHCQNRSESNDVATSGVTIGNDGGFMYNPALDTSKSEPVTRPDGTVEIPSYGSMTYAGLMSFLNASVDRSDPRVQAAYGWITRHYTLDENPGLSARGKPESGRQGLYYYFVTFAKALNAWGDAELKGADGAAHPWARDLAARVIELQKPDGSWENDVKRWWEGDPTLVTSYTLLVLDIARPWLDKTSINDPLPRSRD